MLNPLSREVNVKASLKKYFVDAFGNAVTFDTSLASPDLRVQGALAIKQWYNVDFGEFGRQDLAEYLFDVYCMSRQDFEGVKLAEMVDTLMNLLVDSSKTDGMRRIPFYNVTDDPWSSIGSMVVQDVWDSPNLPMVEDETKVKILSVRLRWGAAM
jgi:hypothetical protein